MFLLNNFKLSFSVVVVSLVLSSCSTVEFPEDFEDDQSNVGGEITSEESAFMPAKNTIKESKSLASDEKNVAYEGEEDENTPDKIPEADKVTPAKTTPIVSNKTLDSEQEELDESGKSFGEIFAEKATSSDSQLSGLEDIKTTVPEQSISYRIETIYFDNGGSSLDSQYIPKIRDIVKLAKANNATVSIYGYASSRTRNTDIVSHKKANFSVSLQRAENVAKAFRKAGMPKDKIMIEALSDTSPAYLEVMPEGERLNRRAEVYISY